MSQPNLKEIIRAEYKRCIEDPIYFMKKYVKIQHPVRGTVAFELYPFQENTLREFVDNSLNIVLKSRQMGISTLTAAYSLWLMTFHSDKNILCISITQETAKEIVTKVRFANDNLPAWLKVPCVEDNRLSLRLKNGSQIKAVSSAGTAGRSAALSLLIIDEAAFIDGIEEIWLSAQYTLSTGGRAIVLSTPNGVGNFFHKTWVEAEEGKNKFKTIRLPWHLHPERDQTWRDKQTELSGVKGAAQECDCDFATSGNQVVSVDILEFYKQTHVKDPVEKRGSQQDLWVWDYPNYSKNYMVTADCARGDGADFSAFHVIDIETMEQVAEYKGQLTTKDYGNLLVTVATEYNNALLVVENNNQGWAALQQVIDRDYQNTFYSSADLAIVDVEKTYTNKLNGLDKKLIPGFSTTTKTRPLVISNLELFFRQKQVIIKSNRLLEELNVFVWNGPKAEAMKGYNDDLVMSFGIGIWVRETALRLRNEQIAYSRAMLGKITRKDSGIITNKDMRDVSPIDDPMKTWQFSAGGVQGGVAGGKKESLNWLL